jgi:nucleotidyltransferase substrate binding protein (TIGR01987 family)
MKLDLSPLNHAFSALEKSMDYLNSDLAQDSDIKEQFRNSAIQCFEFTYELAVKMLRRHLARISSDAYNVQQMSYMELIRTSAQAGLLTEVAHYRKYRDMRNITSHTYDVNRAEEIIAILPDFRNDIRALLAELEKRNIDDI